MEAVKPIEAPSSATFLDVPVLLELSEPRPRVPWAWYAAAAFCLMMLTTTFGKGTEQSRQAVQVFSGLFMLGLLGGMAVFAVRSTAATRAAQEAVDGVAELLQLRRWPQAAFLIRQILSRPARTPEIRAQALVYLAMVLSRYHQFEEAISVHEYLLKEGLVDEATAVGLKLGRAMAMLREDHLFDADRAINELRRINGAAGSAGLALVELYRDVKTGHPDDAVAAFEKKLPVFREQLGHRLADAYGLVARAYDLQGRAAEAASAWLDATVLAPAIELCRRYPELEKVRARFPVAPAPAEMS